MQPTQHPLRPRAPRALTAARRAALVALAAASCLAGCVTTAQFGELERRVVVMERAELSRREQLEEARRQVETLNEQLRLAQVQVRNVADLGARLDGFEEAIRTVRGSLDEVRRTLEGAVGENSAARGSLAQQLATVDRRLGELERRVGLAPVVSANQIPGDNAMALSQGRQALDARDYARARALAQAVLDRAPQDPLADDARLLVARTHMGENRTATGLQELVRLVQDFPSGDAVPDALTEMAEGYVRLGWCTDAQRTLRLLTERHASTPQGARARTRLTEVQRLPRTSCTR